MMAAENLAEEVGVNQACGAMDGNRSRAGAMNLQIALDFAPHFRPQCSYEQCTVEDRAAT
jgi:hypothetical protein